MKDNKCEQCGKEIDYKRFRRKYCIECASQRNSFAFIKKRCTKEGFNQGLEKAKELMIEHSGCPWVHINDTTQEGCFWQIKRKIEELKMSDTA